MNIIQKRKILKEFKKMLLTGGMITTGAASLTGCNNTKTGSNTTEPTQIVTEASTESVTPTIDVTPTEAVATITTVPTPYPEDYFEYDDEEPTYEGSLVDGYDPNKFVIGPDGKNYDSQESIDLIFGEGVVNPDLTYTYGGYTYENEITYWKFRAGFIELEPNEDGILVEKPYETTKCK